MLDLDWSGESGWVSEKRSVGQLREAEDGAKAGCEVRPETEKREAVERSHDENVR